MDEIIPATELPTIQINLPELPEKKDLIEDQQLIRLYTEILDLMRLDRQEVDSLLNNFTDMVINDGDSSHSSKEALVALVKIKSDTTLNMTKILEILIRSKSRRPDYKPQLTASQHNEIKIGRTEKRKLLDRVAKKIKEQDVPELESDLLGSGTNSDCTSAACE